MGMSSELHGCVGSSVPEAGLEWSSPAGPAALSWLAGPWRRAERALQADDRLELFRVRLGADVTPARASHPHLILADAALRLRAALGQSDSTLQRAAAELRRAPQDLASISDSLVDLWRRATAPARVETWIGEQPCLISDLGATGAGATFLVTAAPAAAIDLHRRAVAAALRTRITLVQAARSTLELAATIVAFSGPGTAALALPLAWRFLHDLLAEHAAAQGK